MASKKHIKRLLNSAKSKSIKQGIMRTLRKHRKKVGKHVVTKKKLRKKLRKKERNKKQTKRRKLIRGVEGVDFKTFNIDPRKPSTCRPRIEKVKRSRCKSHRMNKGQFIINQVIKPVKIETPKKKCKKSVVHFINL